MHRVGKVILYLLIYWAKIRPNHEVYIVDSDRMGNILSGQTRMAGRNQHVGPTLVFQSSPPLKHNNKARPIYDYSKQKWEVEVEEEEVEEDPTPAEAAVETRKPVKEVQLLEKHFSSKVDSYLIGVLPPPIAIQVLSLFDCSEI